MESLLEEIVAFEMKMPIEKLRKLKQNNLQKYIKLLTK